jgi:hypothetical protein
MSAIFSSRRFAIVVTALLAFAFPALAGHPRPFKGWAFEALTGPPVPVEGGFLLSADGAGEATHLGPFTRHADVFLHDDGTGHIEGEVVFIADNGHELYAHLDGTFVPGGPVFGSYTFHGGTGRFADASGSADFSGTNDGVSAAITFVGKIQY